MVDSQFPEMIPKLKAAIREAGGGDIDFTINTHWHFDHADGNPILGREGSWLISHINSRRMMLREKTMGFGDRTYIQAPYPTEGLPVLTFDDRMQMFFNGQRIDILHFGAAHTTGDAIIYFRNDNVVHMGDTFFAGYPFIDTRHGGHLDGMIAFCKSVLTTIDEDTQVVPGHGPVLSYDDLANYVAMLKTVRNRVSTLIDRGYSLEAVMEAKPTKEFDETRGNPTRFIRGAYDSLSQ
jgi:glyoxylase-like metal-dependent hydrolase (beta-lactamase superfamily II)